jgi:hypothetical protein
VREDASAAPTGASVFVSLDVAPLSAPVIEMVLRSGERLPIGAIQPQQGC